MATIKSYTDINQSKKLTEILPLESADMYWRSLKLNGHISWTSHIKRLEPPLYDFEHYAPCWSLAALLDVLHDYTLQTNTDGTVFVVCESQKPMISDAYDNPIDACVAMIEKLHELRIL